MGSRYHGRPTRQTLAVRQEFHNFSPVTPMDLWRRRLGLIFIGGSLLMVVLGFTVLMTKLAGAAFLIYWLGCAALAVLALGTAALDLLIVNARAREERKALARDAAEKIKLALERDAGQPNSR